MPFGGCINIGLALAGPGGKAVTVSVVDQAGRGSFHDRPRGKLLEGSKLLRSNLRSNNRLCHIPRGEQLQGRSFRGCDRVGRAAIVVKQVRTIIIATFKFAAE